MSSPSKEQSNVITLQGNDPRQLRPCNLGQVTSLSGENQFPEASSPACVSGPRVMLSLGSLEAQTQRDGSALI